MRNIKTKVVLGKNTNTSLEIPLKSEYSLIINDYDKKIETFSSTIDYLLIDTTNVTNIEFIKKGWSKNSTTFDMDKIKHKTIDNE